MKNKSINYNFIMNLIYSIALYIFPLITYPYVTRILNPEGIGKVTFAQSFSTYFSICAIFGMTTYASRGVALRKEKKNELNKFVQEILLLEILLSAIVFIVYLLVVFNLPILSVRKPELLLMSVNIFTGGISAIWLYTGLEQYGVITKRFLICKSFAVVVLFLTVKNQNDYLWYAIFTFLSDTVVNVWNLFTIHNYVSIKPMGNYKFGIHMKSSVAFFATTIANCVYTNLDSIMLTFISGDVQTGFYSTALKIKQLLTAIVLSLARVLLPRISFELQEGNEEKVTRILQKAMHITFLMSLFFTIFGIVYAGDIITIFAGQSFSEAGYTLCWSVASVLVFSISALFTEQIFIAYGMEKSVTVFIAIGAICDLVLNALFMPKWGAAGGAAATFLTELIVLVLSYRKARNLHNNYFKELCIWKMGVLVVSELVWLLTIQYIFKTNMIIKILLGGSGYVILFVTILVLQKNPIALAVKEHCFKLIKK